MAAATIQKCLLNAIGPPSFDTTSLLRPTFRCLHTIFTRVMEHTRYGKGLFPASHTILLPAGGALQAPFHNTESRLSFLQRWVEFVALTTESAMTCEAKHMAAGQEVDATHKFIQLFVNTAMVYASSPSSLPCSHDRAITMVLNQTPSNGSHHNGNNSSSTAPSSSSSSSSAGNHHLTLLPMTPSSIEDAPISPATDSDSAASTPIDSSSSLLGSAPITRRRLSPRPPMAISMSFATNQSNSSNISNNGGADSGISTPDMLSPANSVSSSNGMSWSPLARIARDRTPSPSSPTHTNNNNGSVGPSSRARHQGRFSPSSMPSSTSSHGPVVGNPNVRFRASSSSEQEDDGTTGSNNNGAPHNPARRLSNDDGTTNSPPLLGLKGNLSARRRPPTGYVRNMTVTTSSNDPITTMMMATTPTNSNNNSNTNTNNGDSSLDIGTPLVRHRLVSPMNSSQTSTNDELSSTHHNGGMTPRQRGVLSMLNGSSSGSNTPSSTTSTPLSSSSGGGSNRASGRRSFGLTPLSATTNGSPLPAFPISAVPSLRINIPPSPSSSALTSSTPSLPALSPLAAVSVSQSSAIDSSSASGLHGRSLLLDAAAAQRRTSPRRHGQTMPIPNSPLMHTRTLATSPRPPLANNNNGDIGMARFNAFSSTSPLPTSHLTPGSIGSNHGSGGGMMTNLSRSSSGEGMELTLQPSLPINDNTNASPPVSPYSSSPFLSAPNVPHGFRKFRAAGSSSSSSSSSNTITPAMMSNGRPSSVSPSPPPSCNTPPPQMLSHARRSPLSPSPGVSPTNASSSMMAMTLNTNNTSSVTIGPLSSGAQTARGRFSFDVSATAMVGADGTITPPPISPNTPNTPGNGAPRSFRRFRAQQQPPSSGGATPSISPTPPITNTMDSGSNRDETSTPLATLAEEEPHEVADLPVVPTRNRSGSGGYTHTHHRRPPSSGALRRMDPLAVPTVPSSAASPSGASDDPPVNDIPLPSLPRRDQPPSLARRISSAQQPHVSPPGGGSTSNDEKTDGHGGQADTRIGSARRSRRLDAAAAAEQKAKESDTSAATTNTPRWGRRALDHGNGNGATTPRVVTTSNMGSGDYSLAISVPDAPSASKQTSLDRVTSLSSVDDIEERKQQRRRFAKEHSGVGHIAKNSLSIDLLNHDTKPTTNWLTPFSADQLKSMTKADLTTLFSQYDRDGRGYLRRGTALNQLCHDIIHRVIAMYTDAIRSNRPSLTDDEVTAMVRRDRAHLLPNGNANGTPAATAASPTSSSSSSSDTNDVEVSNMRTAIMVHFDSTKQGKIMRNDFVELWNSFAQNMFKLRHDKLSCIIL